MVQAENPNVNKEVCTIEIYLRVLVADLLGELDGLPFIVSKLVDGGILVHCVYLSEDVSVDGSQLLLHLLAASGVIPRRCDGGRRRRGERCSVGGSRHGGGVSHKWA